MILLLRNIPQLSRDHPPRIQFGNHRLTKDFSVATFNTATSSELIW